MVKSYISYISIFFNWKSLLRKWNLNLFWYLAVYCNLTVPESPEESEAIATHNAESLAANDSDWNSFKRIVNYTCPEGSVLEYPNQVSN